MGELNGRERRQRRIAVWCDMKMSDRKKEAPFGCILITKTQKQNAEFTRLSLSHIEHGGSTTKPAH